MEALKPSLAAIVAIVPLTALASACLVSACTLSACTGGSNVRDVSGRRADALDAGEVADASVLAPPPRASARPTVSGVRPRLLATASSRAIAIDATHVYYGDNDDDGLFAIAKTGGEPLRLTRRAPVAGGLAIDGDALAWIATPGDVVLRLPTSGGTPTTVRERGIFADVAASAGDVFVAEASGRGGSLSRFSGGATTMLATLEGAPRSIVVDATHCYVATAQQVLRVPRQRGPVEVLASGNGFDTPALDEANVYVTTESASGGRVVVRIPKTGGAPEAVATSVRAAPIAIAGGELFYFDAQRAVLRAVPAAGGPARAVSFDDRLGRPNAIAIDDDAIYVATGEREDGAVLAIARK